jgi:hypothetical protein
MASIQAYINCDLVVDHQNSRGKIFFVKEMNPNLKKKNRLSNKKKIHCKIN